MLSVLMCLLSFLLYPGCGSTRVPWLAPDLSLPGSSWGSWCSSEGFSGGSHFWTGILSTARSRKTLLMSLNQRRCVILTDREALRYAAPSWAIQGLSQVSKNVGPSFPHPPWPFGWLWRLVPWSHDHQTSQRQTSRSPPPAPAKREDFWWGPS